MRHGRSGSGAVLLELAHVSKTIGATRALSDVSLHVTAHRNLAVLGRAGAGKSVLVSVISGRAGQDTGTVRLAGRLAPDVPDPSWQHKVHCVPQRCDLVPSLTVAENFLLRQPQERRHPVDRSRIDDHAGELLHRWLPHVRARDRVGELSAADRRLLGVVRGLSTGAALVVFDEPTAGLEPLQAARLFDTMREAQDFGVTFLVTSRHARDVLEVCDDVAVLRDGHRVGGGDIAALAVDEVLTMVGAAA